MVDTMFCEEKLYANICTYTGIATLSVIHYFGITDLEVLATDSDPATVAISI